MNKLSIDKMFSLAFKFSAKYCLEYFSLLLKPAAFGVIAIFSVIIVYINPYFAPLSLIISIPSICYCFWRGFLITYTLNYAALDFLKNKDNSRKIAEFFPLVKRKESEIAKYLLFCAVVTIIVFLPAIFYLISLANNFQIENIMKNIFSMIFFWAVTLVNSVILLPFLNFSNQALFFREPNENFFDLFLNCYRKLNPQGAFLSFIFPLLGSFAGAFSFFAIFIIIFLNLIYFSVNTFWYHSTKKV